jgi:hypothetical protein
VLISILLVSSCEEELTEIGSGFINGIKVQEPFVVENISAYNEKIQSVQTNNATLYKLGTYNDPVFGTSETSILTQLTLEEVDHDFGQEPQLDSVILTIPYFSEQIDQEEYELDSIFGQGSFEIQISESNQFLRTVDPGENGDFENTQIYYSDQLNDFLPNIDTANPIFTSDPIIPSDATNELVLFDQLSDDVIDTLNVSPRIRLKLPNQFFEDKILSKAGEEELISNQNFVNYFRGIYIKAQQTTNEPIMGLFDLVQEDAGITMFYKSMRNAPSLEPDAPDSLVETFNKFKLNFTGIKTNLYEKNELVDLSNPDTENGDENLYLQGGQGSMGVLKLFDGPDSDNDGVSDELDSLRSKNQLVNEATLRLYVNQELAPSSINRTNRIFIYDLDNNRLLIDYQIDPTASPNVPDQSRTLHLAPLAQDEDNNPFYKIRLTSHINDIINNDSTNVTLGLNVAQNVENARLFDVRESETDRIDGLIETSLTTPRGVVLHGTESANETKRLKLSIQTTENN